MGPGRCVECRSDSLPSGWSSRHQGKIRLEPERCKRYTSHITMSAGKRLQAYNIGNNFFVRYWYIFFVRYRYIFWKIYFKEVSIKKSFDLRSLNFTPLKRGDQSLKEKFYSVASGANISLWGMFLLCINIALHGFNGVGPIGPIGPMYRYWRNVSISHYMLLHNFSGEKTGVYSFLCSTLLGLCRSY